MIDFKPTLSTDSELSQRNARRPRLWAASVGILALAAAGTADLLLPHHGGTAAAPTEAVATTPSVPVSVAVVTPRDMAVWTDFSGRIEAVNRVEIRPRAAGAVISTHFREGALVKQGDLLFTIDPAPYLADVDRLNAQVAAAGARLVLAAREQQRGLRLGSTDDLPQSSVDARVNEFQAAEANLHATQAELDTVKLNLGYTEVRAPIAGRAGRIDVTPGNLVPAGPTAPVLTTLVSVNPIYASFDADEQSVAAAVASLPPGGDLSDRIARIPVQLGTLETDGTPVVGHLQLVDNEVDAGSGTVRLRAVFDNADGRLMPGQFARVRLGQATTARLIAIQERAIGTDQDHRFVMVVDKDNKVAYRRVSLGGVADGLRIITAGLNPGERIVVDGLEHIQPGSLVSPEPVAPDADAFASR